MNNSRLKLTELPYQFAVETRATFTLEISSFFATIPELIAFDTHLVLQFVIHSTLPEGIMNGFSIQLMPPDDDYGLSIMEEFTIPASRILAE
jgi:hypothetical protein